MAKEINEKKYEEIDLEYLEEEFEKQTKSKSAKTKKSKPNKERPKTPKISIDHTDGKLLIIFLQSPFQMTNTVLKLVTVFQNPN